MLVALTIYDNISVDIALQGAVYRGIFASANLTSAVDVTCQTGNCTWPVFASLGACSTCHDVTADSIIIGSGSSVEIPGGLALKFIAPGSGSGCDEFGCNTKSPGLAAPLATNVTNITLDRNPTANIITMALGQLKLDDSILDSDLTDHNDWRAFHCSLDLCIKHYSNFTVVSYASTPGIHNNPSLSL